MTVAHFLYPKLVPAPKVIILAATEAVVTEVVTETVKEGTEIVR